MSSLTGTITDLGLSVDAIYEVAHVIVSVAVAVVGVRLIKFGIDQVDAILWDRKLARMDHEYSEMMDNRE